MNEQLEVFRRRLRGSGAPEQTRERIKGKEWVAILISIAALGLSAVTAYFSFVRQSEEMRVFLGQIPLLTRADDGRLLLEGNLDIAFMNTGTRPIIIKLVGLLIEDISKRGGDSDPCGLSFGSRLFEVDSFVVKEKESVSKLLRLRFDSSKPSSDLKLTEDGRISMSAPTDSSGKPSRSVIACVRIAGATQSRNSLSADISLADFEWSARGPAAIGYPTVSFHPPPPFVIWTKQGTIFDKD